MFMLAIWQCPNLLLNMNILCPSECILRPSMYQVQYNVLWITMEGRNLPSNNLSQVKMYVDCQAQSYARVGILVPLFLLLSCIVPSQESQDDESDICMQWHEVILRAWRLVLFRILCHDVGVLVTQSKNIYYCPTCPCLPFKVPILLPKYKVITYQRKVVSLLTTYLCDYTRKSASANGSLGALP